MNTRINPTLLAEQMVDLLEKMSKSEGMSELTMHASALEALNCLASSLEVQNSDGSWEQLHKEETEDAG